MIVGPTAFTVERPGGVELRGRRWAPDPSTPPRPPVVIVHGLGEHGGRYGMLAEALTRAGHPVVAHDQRGHGRSPGRRGVLADVDTLVDDLLAVRGWVEGALSPAGPPILFGHSMGGLVVLRALQARGASWSAAVLSAPWLATALPVPGWKRALEPLLARLAPRLTVAGGIRGEMLTRDPEQIRLRDRDPEVHDRVSAGLAAAAARAQEAAWQGGLPEGLPVLLLVPGEDPVVDAAAVRRWARETNAPALRVVDLEGRRHEPHNDLEREEVFRLLVSWLATVGGSEQGPPEWVSSSGQSPATAERTSPRHDRHD